MFLVNGMASNIGQDDIERICVQHGSGKEEKKYGEGGIVCMVMLQYEVTLEQNRRNLPKLMFDRFQNIIFHLQPDGKIDGVFSLN